MPLPPNVPGSWARRSAHRLAVTLPSMLVVILCLSAALLCARAVPAAAAVGTQGWTRVVARGLTDPNNSYAPYYVRYRGQLYMSTLATGAGILYSGSHKLGGEIWRTSDGVHWARVGKPGLGDPDNATFQLAVFQDRLYAVSTNSAKSGGGLQVWVSAGGSSFTRVDVGALGAPGNTSASPMVFAGRLILGVTNLKAGAQIWVSEDGRTFRRVVTGGMGDSHNTGVEVVADLPQRGLTFAGRLYVGVSNLVSGGQIWSTADGLQWQRVADGGMGRRANAVLFPNVVFRDQLYAVGVAAALPANARGIEVYRTANGTTWERVVRSGVDAGARRNALGFLSVFGDRIYLAASGADPRVLLPGRPTERFAPRGFQLWRSSDGASWTQVEEDGFGADTTFAATAMLTLGSTAYLAAYDYRHGEQLWRSNDGVSWDLMFRQPRPSWYAEGGGPIEFQGHLLLVDNDLKRGVEIWRTDDAVFAHATSSATPSATPVTGSSHGASPSGGAGAQSGAGDQGEGAGGGAAGGGLSGLWIGLVVAIVVAIGGLAVLVVARRRTAGRQSAPRRPVPPDPAAPSGGRGTTNVAPASPVVAPPSLSPTSEEQGTGSPPGRAYCSSCGAVLDPGARFCAFCGASVPGRT